MNQQVKRLVERAGAAFGVVGLTATLIVAFLLAPNAPKVHALPTGGQVQSRAIYMSTSIPSATGQSYLVTFKPASTTAIAGVILDFCAESPIIGDGTCSAPDSLAASPTFDVGATPSVSFAGTSTGSGDPITTTGLAANTGSWTATGLNAVGGKYRTVELTNATGDTGALSTATTYSFLVSGVTNPAQYDDDAGGPDPVAPHSFYARLITYTSYNGDITSYTPSTPGSTDALDYGGFALSTTNSVNITAKVQETLGFCVNKNDIGSTGNQCGDTTATAPGNLPNLTIGHGATVKIIDNSQIDTTTAYMQISTNASTGAVVRMHAGNSCSASSNNGGLSNGNGTTCPIPGLGNVSAAAALVAALPNTGGAAFGLFVGSGYTSTGISASTGTINPAATYHDNSHSTESVNPDGSLTSVSGLYFGMDTTANSGVNGTYGSVIADTNSAPCNTVNAHLVFGAIASLTTPAGIYTGSESLIATGTF